MKTEGMEHQVEKFIVEMSARFKAGNLKSFSTPKTSKDLAPFIDHTLLKNDASDVMLKKVCDEARDNKFATVCVNSNRIEYVSKLLNGSTVKPICVVGFPHGTVLTTAKAYETKSAVLLGAQEIDMVISIGELKEKKYSYVFNDIKSVVDAAGNVPVKVILEISQLSLEEKIAGCFLSEKAGAAFVKTSTGFSTGGATVEDVQLMRLCVSDAVQVKASGGIRNADDAFKMIRAGATRLGTSGGVAIVNDQKTSGGGY